ncbi:MAG: transcription elongation factor GreA [Clostridia bacterium]|nr:transcription elongation factor GreA [Clostridia bacterium]
MAEIWLTEREVEKRRQKLDYLKGERRLEIAEMLKIARGFGDLSENAEYDAAKNEQAKNEYDIAVLEDELQHVHIIDESTLASGGVNIGTTITVRNAKNGFETTYQIVGTTEADPRKGKISNESPIGAALIGHKAGEKVDVHTPGGLLELEIVCINA